MSKRRLGGWSGVGLLATLTSLAMFAGCGKTDQRPQRTTTVAGHATAGTESLGDTQAGAGGAGASDAAAGAGAGGVGQAGAAGEACFDTPRDEHDLEVNAETLGMVALAPPERLVPLYIALVDIPPPSHDGKSTAEWIAETEAQLAPYQDPIQERLEALGVTDVGRFWTSNALSASVEARYVPELLCWPNVVSLEVDAAYWLIADPPWGDDQAGSEECPLTGETCPEHCQPLHGFAVVDGFACDNPVVAACTRLQSFIDDGDVVCRQRSDTSEVYLFAGTAPLEPAYLHWQECPGPLPVLEACGGGGP